MSYDGPGLYRHYKGGEYTVLGVTEHESTGQLTVVYFSHDAGRTAERASRGVDFINRPLNKDDGLDAWNVLVRLEPENGEPFDVPRFVRIA